MPRPRLNWIPVPGRRAQTEAAFQVQVASRPDHLASGRADVWDSGRAERTLAGPFATGPAAIPYGGPDLSSRARYFWRVRVWDERGEPSAWSDVAFWEMGLLAPEDWQARWIGAPEDARPDGERPAPLLRTDFRLDKPLARARAYVCGLGYYDLFLNGHRVGDSVLDPAFTQYDRRIAYTVHDITAHLRAGANAAGVVLGRGWYGLTTPSVWNHHTGAWHGEPRLLLQIEVDHPDGTRTTIVSDGTWRAHDGPTRSDSILAGEHYDARCEGPGWKSPGFDDSGWPAARLLAPLSARLFAQAHPPIRVARSVHPVALSRPHPETCVYDMGENIAGWARLRVFGPAGQIVTLRYGERLRPDGTVDNANSLIDAEAQCDRYTLKGDGAEVFEPRFSYKGFRYVQVDGYPGTPMLDDLAGREVHSEMPETGSFSCSEPLLNAIHRLTRRSLLNNWYGIPTDTPVYEKNGWTGDAHLTADAALLNFDTITLYAKWLDDIADAQGEDGLVPLIVPCSGWGRDSAPEWGIAYLEVAWTLYRHTGDPQFLSRHVDGMRRYVDYLLARVRDGLSPSVLSDWVAPLGAPDRPEDGSGHPGNAPEGPALTATAYVYRAASLLSRMYARLAESGEAHSAELAERYAGAAERIRAGLNAKLYDPERGVYHTDREAGYRQTSNVLPLAFGLPPESEQGRILANLVADVRAKGDHLDTGILGTKYLLPVLCARGHADLAFRVATQRTYPSWGFWVANGATALWESWERTARSLGHHMYGSIDDWLYGYLAGIRWEAGRTVIRPYLPEGLTHAEAAVETVCGTVASSWTREAGGTVRLDVTIPARGLSAEVLVPAARLEEVCEGGEPLSDPKAARERGIVYAGMENGWAAFTVGPGTYRFTGRAPAAQPL